MTTKVSVFKDPRKKRPYVVRWFGWPDPITGTQKRYSKSFGTKREANEFARNKANEFDGGTTRDPVEEVTLGRLCRDFLKLKSANRKAPATVDGYNRTADRLMKHFGAEHPLRRITQASAELFVAQVSAVKETRSFSEWSRHRVYREARAMFGKAVQWKWITDNPFEEIEKPSLQLRDWQYIGANQYNALLDAAPNLRWQAVYALAYTAGLRRGELFSLTWADVDFDKGVLHVRPREATDALPPFKPKTQSSIRTIPLPKQTVELLQRLRVSKAMKDGPYVALTGRQYEALKARWQNFRGKGRTWEARDIVNNLPRRFRQDLRKAGIERRPGTTLTFHTLRKCAGKNWSDAIPNPKVVQRLMGHSSLATTMKYYNQINSTDMQNAADAVERLLSKTDARLTPGSKNVG